MRRWKPQPAIGIWIAAVLLAGVLALGGVLAAEIGRPLSGPPESWPFDMMLYWRGVALLILLMMAGALIYRIVAAATLSYHLDRNGLYITWLGNRAVVPLDQIQRVDAGVAAKRLPWGPLQRVGYFWGQGHTADGGVLYLFSTQSPARCLAIRTSNATYAISPADREAFVQDLEQRRNLGATMPLAPTVEPSGMFLYAFWNDRTVRTLLLLAFALNLLVLGLLAARYPQLGPQVQMRFNAAGEAADLRPRHQVLFLPLAAFGLSLLNTALGLLLYRSQQLGARLLQGASVVVQVLFSIAVATIIR